MDPQAKAKVLSLLSEGLTNALGSYIRIGGPAQMPYSQRVVFKASNPEAMGSDAYVTEVENYYDAQRIFGRVYPGYVIPWAAELQALLESLDSWPGESLGALWWIEQTLVAYLELTGTFPTPPPNVFAAEKVDELEQSLQNGGFVVEVTCPVSGLYVREARTFGGDGFTLQLEPWRSKHIAEGLTRYPNDRDAFLLNHYHSLMTFRRFLPFGAILDFELQFLLRSVSLVSPTYAYAGPILRHAFGPLAVGLSYSSGPHGGDTRALFMSNAAAPMLAESYKLCASYAQGDLTAIAHAPSREDVFSRAFGFYLDALREGHFARRIVFTISGLECVYTRDDKEGQIEVKQRCGKLQALLGRSPSAAFARLSDAYELRNKYLHGNSITGVFTRLNAADPGLRKFCDELADLLRQRMVLEILWPSGLDDNSPNLNGRLSECLINSSLEGELVTKLKSLSAYDLAVSKRWEPNLDEVKRLGSVFKPRTRA